MTTTIRGGKLVCIGKQQKYFPPIARSSPLGALDSAHEPDDKDEAHAAAVAHVGDCSDEQAQELQDALDRRAGARARDKRARDEEQPELPSREEAYMRARDADPDPRRDFASQASGRPDRPASDSRMAHDAARRARAAAAVDIGALFPAQHPHAHHDS